MTGHPSVCCRASCRQAHCTDCQPCQAKTTPCVTQQPGSQLGPSVLRQQHHHASASIPCGCCPAHVKGQLGAGPAAAAPSLHIQLQRRTPCRPATCDTSLWHSSCPAAVLREQRQWTVPAALPDDLRRAGHMPSSQACWLTPHSRQTCRNCSQQQTPQPCAKGRAQAARTQLHPCALRNLQRRACSPAKQQKPMPPRARLAVAAAAAQTMEQCQRGGAASARTLHHTVPGACRPLS